MPANANKTFYEFASYSNRLLARLGGSVQGPPDAYTIDPEATLYQQPLAPSYTKPVVCLINEYCYSTCEGIAMGFSNLPRARSQVSKHIHPGFICV